jgi:hypothetical protein
MIIDNGTCLQNKYFNIRIWIHRKKKESNRTKKTIYILDIL